MTGTIDATIVGDDYRFDHDNTLSRVHVRRPHVGPHQARRGDAQHDDGPGARARQRRRRRPRAAPAMLGFPVADIMFDVHGGIDAPMTLGGSYRFPEIETTDHRRRGGPAAARPRRARRRRVVADTQDAPTISDDRVCAAASSAITGDVVANITDRTWSGKLHVDAPNAEELQADVPEAWRVAGPRARRCDPRRHLRQLPARHHDQRHRARRGPGSRSIARRPRRSSPLKRSTCRRSSCTRARAFSTAASATRGRPALTTPA